NTFLLSAQPATANKIARYTIARRLIDQIENIACDYFNCYSPSIVFIARNLQPNFSANALYYGSLKNKHKEMRIIFN
ncbi:MAG: hypothetical protein VX076_04305, partial [Pseudomonadota bacterium]|nr:hypothetical protein [Pseudomonadota bacterium]